MSSLIDSYRWTDGVTSVDEVINEIFRNLDQRVDAAERRNTIRYFIPGAVSAATLLRFPWPFKSTKVDVSLSVLDPPTGAAIFFQLLNNGNGIYGSEDRPFISAGSKDSGSGYNEDPADVSTFALNDEFAVRADSVGSINPGSDLSIILRTEKLP